MQKNTFLNIALKVRKNVLKKYIFIYQKTTQLQHLDKDFFNLENLSFKDLREVLSSSVENSFAANLITKNENFAAG